FAADGKPFRGATVRAQKDDLIFLKNTNNQGRFRFTLGPGRWKITLDPQGFFTSPPAYSFDLDENQERSAEFQLFSGGLVYGRVSFATQGVEHARVEALRTADGELVQETETNPQGNYTLGLQAGVYDIVVTAPNFLPVRESVSLSTGESLTRDFELTEAGFVTGEIINLETAQPVAGATVFVLEDTTIRTTSAADGTYFLGIPPNTPLQIDAALPGFGSNGPFTVTAASGETITQNFFLKALSGVIQGQVTDGFRPLPDATVTFVGEDLTLTTDSDGRFRVELPPGSYTIEASKTCHFSRQTSVELVAGDELNVNIVLQPLASIVTGTVTEVGGAPIAGASVTAVSDTVFSEVTDSTGAFELCLTAGIFRITAEQPGYLSADTTLVISDGDSIGGLRFVLRDNFARLSGTVFDQDQVPVPQAAVTLKNANQVLTDTTDATGRYQFARIVPGLSTITPGKPGFYGESTTQFLPGQQDATLDLVLFPANGTISGAVRDARDSTAIAAVTIRAEFSRGGSDFFSTETDSAGLYTLSNLPVVPNATYQIFAFKEDFFTPAPRSNVPVNATGVDFFLVRKSGSISGLVLDFDTAEPLSGVRVEATNRNGGRETAFTDETGQFVVADLVPTELYDLTAQKAGYFSETKENVVPGDSSVVLQLRRRYGFVEGQVLDASSGQPLAQVPMRAVPLGGEGREVTGMTGADGRYRLRLIADFYSVRPDLSHHRSSPDNIQVTVAELDTVRDIDFTLESQVVQSISVQRGDESSDPRISNLAQLCFVATAFDAGGRPVNIGRPTWRLDVSPRAATIDSMGCLQLNPNFFGDLTVTATDSVSGVSGSLKLQVFAPIDPTTSELLFDDRGLQLLISEGAVGSRKELLVAKVPLAPAKKGRAELFAEDSSYVLKPAGLTFDRSLQLRLPPPRNTAGQERFIGKWDAKNSLWIKMPSLEAPDNLIQAEIQETGEYAALALSKSLAVEGLSLKPNPFSPFQETDGQPGLRIEFNISSDAAPNPLFSIKIYNLEGNLVRLLHDQTPFPQGHSVVYWDGRTDNGRLARNGRYLVRLIVEDPEGKKDIMKSVVMIK
ncbi:MAG: hypothetical protein D6743_04265, partial [Calditrichaeota bacterium]